MTTPPRTALFGAVITVAIGVLLSTRDGTLTAGDIFGPIFLRTFCAGWIGFHEQDRDALLERARASRGTAPLYVPSEEQVLHFQERGFVHLEGIIPPEFLDTLTEFRDSTLRKLGGRRNLVPFFHGSQIYDSEISRALFAGSAAAAVGSSLLRRPGAGISASSSKLGWGGGPAVRYVYDALLLDWAERKVHEPPNGFGRFHADRESRLGPDENLVTIFMPLVDLKDYGCTQFLPRDRVPAEHGARMRRKANMRADLDDDLREIGALPDDLSAAATAGSGPFSGESTKEWDGEGMSLALAFERFWFGSPSLLDSRSPPAPPLDLDDTDTTAAEDPTKTATAAAAAAAATATATAATNASEILETVCGKPGDVLAFSFDVVHRRMPKPSASKRRRSATPTPTPTPTPDEKALRSAFLLRLAVDSPETVYRRNADHKFFGLVAAATDCFGVLKTTWLDPDAEGGTGQSVAKDDLRFPVLSLRATQAEKGGGKHPTSPPMRASGYLGRALACMWYEGRFWTQNALFATT